MQEREIQKELKHVVSKVDKTTIQKIRGVKLSLVQMMEILSELLDKCGDKLERKYPIVYMRLKQLDIKITKKVNYEKAA